MNRLERLDQRLAQIEKVSLGILLGAMIVLAFLQIVLRNLFDTGLPWADSMVRYLVLWVGFIGAALSVKKNKHIAIDVFSPWLPPGGRRLSRIGVALFSCAVCVVLTYAAGKFVRNEFLMGENAFLTLPVWLLASIIPFAFAMASLRYAFDAYKQFQRMRTGPPNGRPAEGL
jgi:TRAP-type C4-dicarboxylate transport system permease small subunit